MITERHGRLYFSKTLIQPVPTRYTPSARSTSTSRHDPAPAGRRREAGLDPAWSRTRGAQRLRMRARTVRPGPVRSQRDRRADDRETGHHGRGGERERNFGGRSVHESRLAPYGPGGHARGRRAERSGAGPPLRLRAARPVLQLARPRLPELACRAVERPLAAAGHAVRAADVPRHGPRLAALPYRLAVIDVQPGYWPEPPHDIEAAQARGYASLQDGQDLDLF